MFKLLHIKNFLSHRNTLIEFSSGITGIIGLSMSGKTSIVRALKWISKNTPSGFDFHSNFTTSNKTSVRLVGTNFDIKHIKTPKGSKYIVKGEQKPFRKIGQSVPDIVSEKINIDSINFHEQLDPLFLITSSPPQIANSIAEITGTDIIIRAFKRIRKDKNKLIAEKKVIDKDISSIRYSLKKYNKLDEVKPIIIELKETTRKIEVKSRMYNELDAIQQDFDYTLKKINELKNIKEIRPIVNKLQDTEDKITNLKKKKEILRNIEISVKFIKESKVNKNKLLKKFILLIKKKQVCPLCLQTIGNNSIKRIKEFYGYEKITSTK